MRLLDMLRGTFWKTRSTAYMCNTCWRGTHTDEVGELPTHFLCDHNECKGKMVALIR